MTTLDHLRLQRQHLAYSFLNEHGGRAYGYDAQFGSYGLSAGFWQTPEEAEEHMARVLAVSTYQRPKWWHFWAWSENKPSKKVWQRVLEIRAEETP